MKQYMEKEKIKKLIRTGIKNAPADKLEEYLTSRIDAAKPSAVYSIFPGVKIGFINPVDEERTKLFYEERIVTCVYSCDDSIIVRLDDGIEYLYEDIMENTDLVRTNDCKIVSEEPFITTANLARNVKELIELYNDYNTVVN